MKQLLPVLLVLAACTSTPTYTPTQQKVIKLAQHLEPDSARYVPLRFGKMEAYTRRDSVSPALAQYTELTDQAATYMMGTAKLVDLTKAGGAPAARLAEVTHQNDSAKAAYGRLMATRTNLLGRATSAVVGQQLTHSWRVGERVDSARFVVFNNGVVKKL